MLFIFLINNNLLVTFSDVSANDSLRMCFAKVKSGNVSRLDLEYECAFSF